MNEDVSSSLQCYLVNISAYGCSRLVPAPCQEEIVYGHYTLHKHYTLYRHNTDTDTDTIEYTDTVLFYRIHTVQCPVHRLYTIHTIIRTTTQTIPFTQHKKIIKDFTHTDKQNE